MSNQVNLFIIFLTGLTTGGLSCLAIQSGLLASVISPVEKDLNDNLLKKNQLLPIVVFLTSKLIAYTLLGAFLGLLGTAITLTPVAKGWFQIAVSIYLLGVALSVLDVHPFFRYFIITPPRFLTRLIKNQTKSTTIFAPAILGAMTVFLPCAVTQATEAVALASASPLYGAAIMAAFILGTTPTFFALGLLFTKIGSKFQRQFSKIIGVILIFLSITTFNGALGLLGSIYTIQNFVSVALDRQGGQVQGQATDLGQVQTVSIEVTNTGYSPNQITLKSGQKARVILHTQNTSGCSRAFTIPKMNISKILPETGTEYLEFMPLNKGPLVFSCSMGMYTGIFNVI